jgi:hypothetical protein
MKAKHLIILITVVSLFTANTLNAQFMRISVYGQQGFVMGDITKEDINSSTAGYVDFSSAGGFEFNYYLKNNLGFGLRFSGSSYGIDTEAYESDLIEMLGISGDQYDLTQSYNFWSFGSELGISYLGSISEKWHIEPYFYFGFNFLTSPANAVVYEQNNTTFEYKTKPQIFAGISYAPGVKMHWNIQKSFGLYFSVEYKGNLFMEDNVKSLNYSYNTLEISEVEKSYTINSINIGLGLAFRFGKGIEK